MSQARNEIVEAQRLVREAARDSLMERVGGLSLDTSRAEAGALELSDTSSTPDHRTESARDEVELCFEVQEPDVLHEEVRASVEVSAHVAGHKKRS